MKQQFKYKVGMTLGTYAPFHRGHELVVKTALDECETLYILIYDDPVRTNIPLFTRTDWVREYYPDFTRVHIKQLWDGPTVLGYTSEIIKLHDDYLTKVMKDIKVDAFYSSEKYGEHVSKALNCVDRQVDPPRVIVPVSGTQVRQDAYRCVKDCLVSPRVYRDLITNVVFLGAPSTGKSTLAEYCAKKMNTVWMPEYGREYWDKHNVGRRLTKVDLHSICIGHIAREDVAIQEANTYLFTDTNAMTTRLFCIYYHGDTTRLIDVRAKECERRYDLVFLCEPDIPYDDTADRSGDANRHLFQRMITEDLRTRRIPYVSLTGDLETRFQKVKATLDALPKKV